MFFSCRDLDSTDVDLDGILRRGRLRSVITSGFALFFNRLRFGFGSRHLKLGIASAMHALRRIGTLPGPVIDEGDAEHTDHKQHTIREEDEVHRRVIVTVGRPAKLLPTRDWGLESCDER